MSVIRNMFMHIIAEISERMDNVRPSAVIGTYRKAGNNYKPV